MDGNCDFIIHDGVLVKYTGPGGDVVIPPGVTAIGDCAFQNCSKLVSVTIPEGVTSIGPAAFAECQNLSTLSIPESVVHIREWAFYLCRKLADRNGFLIVNRILFGYFGKEGYVSVREGVTAIDDFVFCDRENLVTVILPESVVRLGLSVFARCSSLSTLILPANIRSLGNLWETVDHLTVLVAPGIAPHAIRSSCRMAAALGYLIHSHRFRHAIITQQYQQYCKNYKQWILPLLFSLDAAQGLAQYAKLGAITTENFDGEFLKPAMEAHAAQCVAFLLEWKNNTPSDGMLQWNL